MTEPRRDIPADAPEIDHVRDAMRYHDERQATDDKGTEQKPERDDTVGSEVPSPPEHHEGSEKP
jgi:hypothetical protein